MMTMTEMLVGMGLRVWTNGAHRRIYLPVGACCALIGLRVSRYGSGNVSAATLGGSKVSNATAREMLADLDGAFYDVDADKFTSCHGVAAAARARLDTLDTAETAEEPVVSI